jgi:DNA-binding XRE family transcriptional regulator
MTYVVRRVGLRVSPHDRHAVKHSLHVGEGLTSLQPARLAGVVGVSDELPPPHQLSPEAALGEAVARSVGAILDGLLRVPHSAHASYGRRTRRSFCGAGVGSARPGGLTQTQLGDRALGISQQHVSLLENDRRCPSSALARALVELLDLDAVTTRLLDVAAVPNVGRCYGVDRAEREKAWRVVHGRGI